MKKILFLLSALMLLGAGCTGQVLTNQPTAAQHATTTAATEDPAELQDELANNYLSSKFRVLKIMKNPFNHSFVFLATERPSINTGCGSIYTSPTCYFFIEPDNFYGAPETHLAAKLTNLGGLDFYTSIKFVDVNRLRFTTVEGDAGYGIEQTWEVNLQTGGSTIIHSREINGQ